MKFQVIAANGRDRLRDGKSGARQQDQRQDLHMYPDAAEANQAEHQKSDGYSVVCQLRHHKGGEIECDFRVEFTFAVPAFAKDGRQLDYPEAAAPSGHEVEQNLESL